MFKSTSNVESENITTIDKRLAEDEKSPEKELSLSITNEKKANKIFILHENFRIVQKGVVLFLNEYIYTKCFIYSRKYCIYF